jgi:hypothetical protein
MEIVMCDDSFPDITWKNTFNTKHLVLCDIGWSSYYDIITDSGYPYYTEGNYVMRAPPFNTRTGVTVQELDDGLDIEQWK